MARSSNRFANGKSYHIIMQGAAANIFKGEADYAVLVEFMFNTAKLRGLEVLAYLVMPDHVHCLIQPLDADGFEGVEQWCTAVQRFHPGLEDYKVYRVQGKVRLMSLVRHLRLEPVKAGLVSDPMDYRWFGQLRSPGVARRTMVADQVAGGRYKDWERQRDGRDRLTVLMLEVCKLMHVSPEQVRVAAGSRRAQDARQLFVYTARHFLKCPESMIADYLGTTTPVIVRSLTAVKYALEDDLEKAAAWLDLVETLYRSTIPKRQD